MKYKAIMLDLDDTTVVHGKDSLPTERVATAIAKAKREIHVCIATARPLREAIPIMDHLKLSGPCVLADGTQIYDPVKNMIIHNVALPDGFLAPIYRVLKENNLKTFLYDGERDITYNGGIAPKNILSVYVPHVVFSDVDRLVDLLSIDPAIHVQKLHAWDKEFMSIHITSSEASKLHGILEVARILNITREEIIGVGDGYNDFPLLMACGLKIAMGNAVPELKAIADFIAPTVQEDGVAIILEKLVLTG